MVKFHSSVIFVKDINKSKNFYMNLLNQEIEHDFNTNIIFKNGLSIWQINPSHIIPQKVDIIKHSSRMELYFETTDIVDSLCMLEDADVQFLHKINEEPWGQLNIRFLDPDGHLIEIGETLETFVNRMKKEGMTEAEIAAKSGIPEETLSKLLKT